MSDLTIYKGRTWTRTLTVTDSTLAPVDITGATIELRIKAHSTDAGSPVIGLGVGSGITILPQTGGTLGQATLTVDGSLSAPIAAGVYVGAVIVTQLGDANPHIVIPPVKIPIRDIP